jgi:hypothetical protein
MGTERDKEARDRAEAQFKKKGGRPKELVVNAIGTAFGGPKETKCGNTAE